MDRIATSFLISFYTSFISFIIYLFYFYNYFYILWIFFISLRLRPFILLTLIFLMISLSLRVNSSTFFPSRLNFCPFTFSDSDSLYKKNYLLFRFLWFPGHPVVVHLVVCTIPSGSSSSLSHSPSLLWTSLYLYF